MKILLVVAIVAGLLILGGMAVVQALDKPVEVETTQIAAPSYSCGGSASYDRGCTAGSNCGSSGCGATNGGSCGCGK